MRHFESHSTHTQNYVLRFGIHTYCTVSIVFAYIVLFAIEGVSGPAEQFCVYKCQNQGDSTEMSPLEFSTIHMREYSMQTIPGMRSRGCIFLMGVGKHMSEAEFVWAKPSQILHRSRVAQLQWACKTLGVEIL